MAASLFDVELGKEYINQQTGETHIVLCIAINNITSERLVITTTVDSPDMTWAYPITTFFEKIEIKEKSIPRFIKRVENNGK